jgi:hypothetical protein
MLSAMAQVRDAAVPPTPGDAGSGDLDDEALRSTISRARKLVEAGRFDEAIEHLTLAHRQHPHPRLARHILKFRHEAFATVADGPGLDSWPPEHPDRLAGTFVAPGPPEVHRDQLDAATLGAGMVNHGSLIVRGLVPPDDIARLVHDIDRSLEAAQAWLAGAPPDETTPWFEIFKPVPPFSVGMSRKFVVKGGGVLAADSPLAICDVIDVFDAAGLRPVLSDYLGERPALSAKKTTLRRVPPDSGSDWHQDGAFLGADIRSVNVWLSLSHCGVDAPGLDIVPRRIDLVETGTEGAIFDWSVGRPVVERAAGEGGVVRPVFAPGDAILFDERNLHATACSPEMTADRHAIEAWFFAPSKYPGDQVPVLF